MKKSILILGLSSLLLANPLNYLSQKQYDMFYKTWKKAQPFNLQYTMTAIVWQESDFGKYLIRLNSKDCGYFQINVTTLSNNHWKQDRICQRLINDYDFGFSVALERFKYFYNYWRSKGYIKAIAWKRAVCSYNAGFNWKKGLKYYRGIVKRIKYIKKFMMKLD